MMMARVMMCRVDGGMGASLTCRGPALAVQHELVKVLQTGAAFRQAESNALQHGHNQTVCAAVCLQARQRRASKYRPWCEHVGVDFRAPACLHAL